MKNMKLMLATLVSVSATAQEADYELVTTAIHTIRTETALPVTVLAGEDLRRASSATLGNTLANQPGINNASFGPAVGQAVIRGQGGRRVMNLSNNLPNADASGNSADHAVTMEPILADAIEVLRGPSTLLYGSGAIGGVVNIIDGRIPRSLHDKSKFAVEARHDTAADLDTLTGRFEFNTGNIAWHVDGVRREWNNMDVPGFAIDPAYLEEDHDEEHDADHDEHDEHEDEEEENTFGYIDNSGGETESFTFGGSWVFDNGFLGLAVNRLTNNYGLPAGSHDHAHEHEEDHDEDHGDEDHDEDHDEHGDEENVFIDMESTRYDLTGEWRNLTPFLEHVDYRLSYSDYEHSEIEGPGEIGTRYSNDSWQQRLQLTHARIGNWHGVLGYQGSSDEFGARGEESFIPVTEIDSNGLFLVEDFHKDNFTVEVGARFNHDEYSPKNISAPQLDFNTFSYSASMLWDFNSIASLGVNASNSERAPSVEELYSNFGLTDFEDCVIHFATGSCEIGSTNFNEEVSRNLDVTLYWEQERISASVTAFYNNFDDYIAQVTTGAEVDGFPIREYQQTDATFKGLEVDITFMLSEYLSLQVFGDTIDGDLGANGDAPRLPPNRFGSRLSADYGNWSGFVSVLYAGAQDQPGNFELPTDSYTRWDIGVDYLVPTDNSGEFRLFVRGRNLGDEEIRLATSFLRGFAPEAGRSVEAGMRFSF